MQCGKSKARLYNQRKKKTCGPIKATRFIYHQKWRNTCVWDNHGTPPLCQDFRNNVVAWKAKQEGLWWFNRCAITVITEFIALPAQMCLDFPEITACSSGSEIWWTLWCCIKKKNSEYCERCLEWTHPKKAAWVFQSTAFQLQQQKQTKQQWKIWILAEKLISWPQRLTHQPPTPQKKSDNWPTLCFQHGVLTTETSRISGPSVRCSYPSRAPLGSHFKTDAI